MLIGKKSGALMPCGAIPRLALVLPVGYKKRETEKVPLWELLMKSLKSFFSQLTRRENA
jgi:hypothetical protein